MNRPPSKLESPTTYGPGEAQTEIQNRWATDKLISIHDIRDLFALGRTAAYELTHRPGFPEPIKLSPRCYRWWANEVTAFAASMRRAVQHRSESALPTGLQVNRRSPRACRRCASPEERVLLAPGKECNSDARQQPPWQRRRKRPQA